MASRRGSHLHGLRFWGMLGCWSFTAAMATCFSYCMILYVWRISLQHQAVADSRADAGSGLI